MLVKSLSYPCATRSLRSYGGLKKKKTLLHNFLEVFLSITRKQGIYLQLYVFLFLLLLRKEVKKDYNYFQRASETSRCLETSRVPCCPCADSLRGSLPNVYLLQKHTSSKKRRDAGSVYEQLKGSQ